MIGAIDGPTAIFVASKLAPEMLGPIAVAAYSYMSLIPIIQPPIMRLMTTRKERLIRMEYAPRPVSPQGGDPFPNCGHDCGQPVSAGCRSADRHADARQPAA